MGDSIIGPDVKCIALVPARSGSKRIPNKNIKEFNGKPLLAWTIAAAHRSGFFGKESIIVSSDSQETLDIAEASGATGLLRPDEISGDMSPDIDWVKHALMHHDCDIFFILRPTSPFRTAMTIKRAWHTFLTCQPCDSLRAVELCKQHPYKMWIMNNWGLMNPFMDKESFYSKSHWHSKPYQSLPEVYVQNASLEIAWRKTVEETNTIAGSTVKPFFTEEYEGYDLNTIDDWDYAEYLVKTGKVRL